eukprot:2355540-Pyramimonas_sp.AAC.1
MPRQAVNSVGGCGAECFAHQQVRIDRQRTSRNVKEQEVRQTGCRGARALEAQTGLRELPHRRARGIVLDPVQTVSTAERTPVAEAAGQRETLARHPT